MNWWSYPDAASFCEHFLLLVIDLEALLPTRRFFNLVMDDSKLVVKSSMSCLSQRPEGKLFGQLLDQVKFYARFEISDETGDPLDDKQMMAIHYDRITSLQQVWSLKADTSAYFTGPYCSFITMWCTLHRRIYFQRQNWHRTKMCIHDTIFLALFLCLQNGVIFFNPSASPRNHSLIGWISQTANQKVLLQ